MKTNFIYIIFSRSTIIKKLYLYHFYFAKSIFFLQTKIDLLIHQIIKILARWRLY